jgi:TP901 family phage tail tape measure protein
VTFRTIEVVFRARDAQLASVLVRSGQQIDTWQRKVESAGAGAARAGTWMQQGLALGTMAAGAAFVYGATKAIAFDKAMRNVNSLTHLSEQGLRGLSEQVLELSRNLPQTAKELAEGLYNVSSSGFAGAKGMQVLEASAQAASAGMSTTETSAKAIVAVLNAYGLTADKAKDVSDVLFQTVNYGVISFDELANNLGDFVGAGAAARVEIDELGAAIAAMTLAGISGAESATSLNQLLTKLVKPSEALAALYEDLGYQSGASALAQKGLYGVMQDIKRATGGNIEALLKLFPEIRAARGAFALMAADGQNYAKTQRLITDEERRRGATLNTLREQMKAVSNQWQVFKNRLDAAFIGGATEALPVLLTLMRAAGTAGSELGEVLGRLGRALEPTWEGLVNAGGDALNVIRDLADAFGPLAAAIATLAVGGVVVTLNALATALSAVTGFLADNESLTMLLAAALGIHLAASAAAAAGGLRSLLTYKALLPMWYALTSAVDAAAGSMTRAKVATGLLNLAVSAGAAYLLIQGVNAFNQWRHAGEDAARAVKQVMDELGSNRDLGSLMDARRQVQQLRSDLGQAPDAGGFWRNFAPDRVLDPDQDAEIRNYRKSVDELAAAEQRLTQMTQQTVSNVQALTVTTGLSEPAVRKLAQAAGVDLADSWQKVSQGIAAYQSKMAAGAESAAEAKLIAAMGRLADSAGDAEEKLQGLKDALDALMGVQLGLNEATRNWEGGLDDLVETLAKARGNLDLASEGGRANSEAIDKQATALKDLVVAQANAGATGDKLNGTWNAGVAALRRTMSQAGFTKKQIDTYMTSLGLVPDNVETIVKAAGANAAAGEVARLRAELERLRSRTVTVTYSEIIRRSYAGPEPGTKRLGVGMNAYGNLYTESYAGGGIRPLPKEAMIARNGANLVQWAEPGTGGEAFIPLAPDRRGRSEEILAAVAEMFGLRVERAAEGMVRLGDVSRARRNELWAKGWRGWNGDNIEALYSPERLRELQDRRWKAGADWQERARLAAPVGLDLSFDLSGAFSATVSRLEQVARNAAELQARRTRNPHDTAEDFYRNPRLRSQQLTTDLARQNQRMRTWRAELAKIARFAGDDVAEQLESMGERGYDAVHAMANASTRSMRAMAKQMRELAAQSQESVGSWQRSMRVSTKETAAFQANLLTLIRRGRVDLASQLASMGAEQAGSIAAGAAGMSNAQLGGLAKDLAANKTATDPQLMEALRLAGILTGTAGLGLVGLSSRSGTSVADVYGLLNRYRSQVFGKLSPTSMLQVNKDLRRIAGGQQPSGLQAGAIVTGAAAASGKLYYRWAEPGSHGESLIPHDPSNRSRALALWKATGQIIGAGAGPVVIAPQVTVAPGAVQVSVALHGTQLTAADAERAATAAATRANEQLLRRLRQKRNVR